jgi:hypothetical protein
VRIQRPLASDVEVTLSLFNIGVTAVDVPAWVKPGIWGAADAPTQQATHPRMVSDGCPLEMEMDGTIFRCVGDWRRSVVP